MGRVQISYILLTPAVPTALHVVKYLKYQAVVLFIESSSPINTATLNTALQYLETSTTAP